MITKMMELTKFGRSLGINTFQGHTILAYLKFIGSSMADPYFKFGGIHFEDSEFQLCLFASGWCHLRVLNVKMCSNLGFSSPGG